MPHSLSLSLLPERLAIAKLPPALAVPAWAATGPLSVVARTAQELSIVALVEAVPLDIAAERGFRALVVASTLDFSAVGILASLVSPLAAAGVPILAFSTFDTDYLLVRERDLERALAALAAAGHSLG